MLKIVNSTQSASWLNAFEQDELINQCKHSNAIKVTDKLQKAGYEAYIVGGAVRDILLGKSPKDFDVATNATPEQIRGLFKNSRIIGRRFQIVHIRFGREIIEVTTFRGEHSKQAGQKESSVSADGLLLRDNVFGSMEEDALRRDFSANALYLDVKASKIYDFCDGLEAIENRSLKLIGDPDQRFKEDPVRILRAVRFAAKLNFTIEPAVIDCFAEDSPLLRKISNARLFDESLKLYIAGAGAATFEKLREHDLLQYLLFNHQVFDGQSTAWQLAKQAMINTDERIRANKSITPAFIYAVLLWPALQAARNTHETAHSLPPINALHAAATDVFIQQTPFTAIPKRFQAAIREIWELQLRLPHTEGKRAFNTYDHPRFRAGYDFLLLREQAGEIPEGLGKFWTTFQEKHPKPEKPKFREARGGKPPRKRPARTSRKRPNPS